MEAAPLSDDLIAFTEERAMKLTGLSRFTLRRLADLDIVRPSIAEPAGGASGPRIYDLNDLVGLTVYAKLRAAGHSAQSLDAYLLEHRETYERPLTELRFAAKQTDSEVLAHHPDGQWDGSRRPKQGRFRDTLDLEDIRADLRRSVGRRNGKPGLVVKTRGTVSSAERFDGTRIRVETVVERLRQGEPDEAILAAYPSLEEADLTTARSLAS